MKAVFVAILFVSAVIGVAFQPPLRLDDLFLYLALGRLQWSGGIPALDPFLFTIPEYHWHPWHEWLSFTYFYGLFRLGGYEAIIFARAALCGGIGYLILRWGLKRGLGFSMSVLIALAALFVAAPRAFHDRASNFSDFFCVLLLAALFSSESKRWRWYLPPLFALWVNLHSSYIFGWFFLGLFVLGQKEDRAKWILCGSLCALATLANPRGLDGALWPVRAVFNPDWGVLGKIVEFEPSYSTRFLSFPYKIFFALFTAVSLFLSARAKAWFPFACALVISALGWRYVRMVGLGGFGLGLVLAQVTPKNWALRTRDFAMALALIVLSVLMPAFTREDSWPLHNTVPVAGVEFLKALPPGKVFNEWQAGGFLAWELDERWKIAAHGFVSDPVLAETQIYRATMTREDWQRIVIDGGVEYFFLRRESFEEMRQAAWVKELEGPGWRPIFADGAAVIFQRARPTPAL